MTPGDSSAPGLAHLFARAGLVEERIRTLVAERRAVDPAPDDPFRGLYLTDDAVDRLLAGSTGDAGGPIAQPTRLAEAERIADAAEKSGAEVRLRRLATAFGLTDLDVELLLIALVPDLDSRFERLYGYLNDDVTRRRATIGLSLALAGASPVSASARARLAPGAPLVDRALVLVEDTDRPFLTRGLRVPDRVTGHLLGDDTGEPALADLTPLLVPGPGTQATALAAALSAQEAPLLIYAREAVAGSGFAMAASALEVAGKPVMPIDLARLAQRPDAGELVTMIGREAALRGAVVLAGPIEPLAEAAREVLWRLASLPLQVVLVGTCTWDSAWVERIAMLMDVQPPDSAARRELWGRELGGGDPGPDALTEQFVLGPAQIVRAVRSARAAAMLAGGRLTVDHLRRGARAQNAAGLERLARRVEPAVGWDDVVLPEAALRQLGELAARARHRERVLREWRMRPGGGRGRGVTALFAGDSGTGKTMSAEVIAGDLGLDLYTVNLATVVDKYVGETEKNLERIFTEAGGVNAVLLFDEADAIFGKRGEVRDAHDRYANIESAYLLQRMETFDGLAVLSTNLRSNIDEAFTRRLDTIVDFPAPDEAARLTLWRKCLAPPLPCSDELDLEFCARAFTLSGGNIRSIALTAAYYAASSGNPIGMPELIGAVAQEYRKLGRLVLEREFGPYLNAGAR